MNPQTTLIICRHGLVENPNDILYYRTVNVSLSDKGHAQMEAVGKKIKAKGFSPERIYTSTLFRAIQSSQEIAKSFPGIAIHPEDNLQDPHVPGIEKKTNAWLAAIEKEGLDVYSHPEFIKIIDTREKVATRMKTVIDKIVQKHPGETIVVVSHGDTIALLKQVLKNPNDPIPSITELKRLGVYPHKGDAWRVTLDTEGNMLKESIITS